MHKNIVKLIGWETGALVVSAINIIKNYSNCGLIEAKRNIEKVLDGHHVDIVVKDENEIINFRNEIRSVKFIIE